MKRPYNAAASAKPALTNGSGMAAVFSGALGCVVLAVLALLADKSDLIHRSLVFYKPSGPLSGVTTVAVLVWLATWLIFDRSWRKKTVSAARFSAVALLLLLLSFILTFPPVGDLF